MKKVLAVLLSVMMLFGALSFSSSAADAQKYFEGNPSLVDPNTQVIIKFDLAGGTMKTPVWVYNEAASPAKFELQENVTDEYIMLPQDSESLKPGYFVTLPELLPPIGYEFDGWYCYGITDVDGNFNPMEGNTHTPNSAYRIPAGSAGQVIEFRALFSPAAVEGDIMDTILGALITVFGSIIGLLFFDSAEQGQELMNGLLGELLG